MDCSYKENWEQTIQNFIDWWNQEGLILDVSTVPRSAGLREPLPDPGLSDSAENRWSDVEWRVEKNHHDFTGQSFPRDTLPRADINLGAGSLALLLGSEPGFEEDTVWFHPYAGAEAKPHKHEPFRFDTENHWWRIHERLAELSMTRGRGRYCVCCPDLVENIDILSALRGPQNLLMDLIENPDWLSEKAWDINAVWFETYDRIYEIIKDEDGSSCFQSFNLWGPGKTAKVQCDASAMLSPDMFERFVLPALTEQCNWIDYSMFHLDGHQCIPHLDLLLSVDSFDAVEWTPDPQVPGGGSPQWYSMYRKILDAGKSVQTILVQPDEVVPLLDAVWGYRR